MRTVIYTRISKDAGTALGIKRPEEDCRAYCENTGWTVAAVVPENDASAYGKRRPLYEATLDDIRPVVDDALVVSHRDRRHRSPKEMESFIARVEATGLTIGSVSRQESEDRSRRLRRHVRCAQAREGRRSPPGTRTPVNRSEAAARSAGNRSTTNSDGPSDELLRGSRDPPRPWWRTPRPDRVPALAPVMQRPRRPTHRRSPQTGRQSPDPHHRAMVTGHPFPP
ncbi:MAG: recombinase family protein [Acidimicrobiia bacterium]|nr:recombinase family protein [Acidimicrobiia bacterium]